MCCLNSAGPRWVTGEGWASRVRAPRMIATMCKWVTTGFQVVAARVHVVCRARYTASSTSTLEQTLCDHLPASCVLSTSQSSSAFTICLVFGEDHVQWPCHTYSLMHAACYCHCCCPWQACNLNGTSPPSSTIFRSFFLSHPGAMITAPALIHRRSFLTVSHHLGGIPLLTSYTDKPSHPCSSALQKRSASHCCPDPHHSWLCQHNRPQPLATSSAATSIPQLPHPCLGHADSFIHHTLLAPEQPPQCFHRIRFSCSQLPPAA